MNLSDIKAFLSEQLELFIYFLVPYSFVCQSKIQYLAQLAKQQQICIALEVLDNLTQKDIDKTKDENDMSVLDFVQQALCQRQKLEEEK